MKTHATTYVDMHEYEEIVNLKKKYKNHFILTNAEDIKYKVGAVVLATGTKHRELDSKGVKDFQGKGISYCATCDGFFFKDKTVCVVGGGNSALIESIYLKQIGCKHVYLIHRREQLRAEEAYEQDAIKAGVEFLLNNTVEEIKGDKTVKSVTLKHVESGEIRSIDTDGVFISIGVLPQNELAKRLDIQLDESGYIKVDRQMRTSVKGVYAAGDITGGLRQVITAAAEGAIAGLTSTEALGKQYPY
jgi:thioredoxin reductase (NADPH)